MHLWERMDSYDNSKIYFCCHRQGSSSELDSRNGWNSSKYSWGCLHCVSVLSLNLIVHFIYCFIVGTGQQSNPFQTKLANMLTQVCSTVSNKEFVLLIRKGKFNQWQCDLILLQSHKQLLFIWIFFFLNCIYMCSCTLKLDTYYNRPSLPSKSIKLVFFNIPF